MFTATPTAEEIACRQLDMALSIYIDKGDLICALTLAGAAEEVIGAMLRARGVQTSLERSIERRQEMFRSAFPEDECPSRKRFADISNQPRNMMKHLTEDRPELIDLDMSAGLLLVRAIENYQAHFGHRTSKMMEFVSEWVARSRIPLK